MTATATYDSGDIEVNFAAETETSDYGVPGSPVWEEIDLSSAVVTSMTILGVDVDFRSLPKTLQEAILNLTEEVDWE